MESLKFKEFFWIFGLADFLK